jgi:hypothetical protein
MLRTLSLAPFSWLLVVATPCFTEMPAGARDSTIASSAEADLQPLIQQLEAAEFAERQAASQKLAEAGAAALPELERAAESTSREVSGRALDVLKQHFQGEDSDLKQAAAAALERLAKSENRSTAQRADRVLNPPKDPEGVVVNGQNAQRIAIAGRIQFGINGFGGGPIPVGNFRRITRREDNNGKRDVEVVENGRKIHLQTFPGGNIEVQITEQQNGRDVTRKVEAKDLDDLKRKDAEAGRLYDQYDNGPFRRQPPIPAPAEVELRLPRPVAIPDLAPPQIPADVQQRMIQQLEQHIERLKTQRPDNPATQRMVESLERQKQRIQVDFPR